MVVVLQFPFDAEDEIDLTLDVLGAALYIPEFLSSDAEWEEKIDEVNTFQDFLLWQWLSQTIESNTTKLNIVIVTSNNLKINPLKSSSFLSCLFNCISTDCCCILTRRILPCLFVNSPLSINAWGGCSIFYYLLTLNPNPYPNPKN